MPGSEKVQPARQSSRIQGGQDTVEGHAGLDIVMEKIVQWEQQDPSLNEREMIDSFRLWGSSRCRRMGETAIAWRCSPGRFTFSTTTTPFSQRAEPSPLWSRLCRETRIGRSLARIAQVRCGNPPCGAAPGCPRLARRVVAPHGRGGSGGSDPCVLTASAAPGRVSRFTSQFTVNPPLGVAPSTVIPRGKAIKRCRGQGR